MKDGIICWSTSNILGYLYMLQIGHTEFQDVADILNHTLYGVCKLPEDYYA